MAVERRASSRSRTVGLWLGCAVFLVLLLFPVDASNPAASRLAAVALLMAVWWVTGAIPLFATALLPLALLPAPGRHGGPRHRADLLQQHGRALPRRIHDRARHGEVGGFTAASRSGSSTRWEAAPPA